MQFICGCHANKIKGVAKHERGNCVTQFLGLGYMECVPAIAAYSWCAGIVGWRARQCIFAYPVGWDIALCLKHKVAMVGWS